MSEIYWNTITENMNQVLRGFARHPIAKSFYLAGGTALSLQIGHRLSVDLDFFSPNEDIPSIRPVLHNALASFEGSLADSSWGNLVFIAQNVRIGFYGYGFPLVSSLVDANGIYLASIEDIALMKLDALLSRASRKDFYDLYFISQTIALRRILNLAPKKYSSVRDFEAQTVKRLVYFELAEVDADPTLLHPVSWQDVKEYFIQQARDIEQTWLK